MCGHTHTRTHTHAHALSLAPCWDARMAVLAFVEKGTSLSGSISPVEQDGTFSHQPETESSKRDVNQRQPKSDKEVDLINPMVLMLTWIINHQPYQVVYLCVPVIQPSDLQWQMLRKGRHWGSGLELGRHVHFIAYSAPFIIRGMLIGHSKFFIILQRKRVFVFFLQLPSCLKKISLVFSLTLNNNVGIWKYCFLTREGKQVWQVSLIVNVLSQ